MAINPQALIWAPQPKTTLSDGRFGAKSELVRNRISRGVKRYMRNSPFKVRELHSKLRNERLGKPRVDLRGRTGPRNGASGPVPSMRIVKLRAAGASLPMIAKECGLSLAGAHYRAGALDLPAGFYDFGEPFTKGCARHLWLLSGLTYDEFAKQVVISVRSLQADLSPNRSGESVDPSRAQKYIIWRDHTVQQLLIRAPGEKGKRVRWGKSAVLKTFFPELRDVRGLLVRNLPRVTDWLNTNRDATFDEFGEWVCAQAQFENKRNTRMHFWRRFLRLLPQLIPAIQEHFDRLRSSNKQFDGRRFSKWALRVLSAHFCVSPSIMQRAMETNAPTILRDTLRSLIEGLPTPMDGRGEPGLRMHGHKRGRQAGETVGDTDSRLVVAANLKLKGITSLSELAKHLYPQQNKKEQRRDSAKKFLRRHADAIRREEEWLAGLSEPERISTVERAEQQLAS